MYVYLIYGTTQTFSYTSLLFYYLLKNSYNMLRNGIVTGGVKRWFRFHNIQEKIFLQLLYIKFETKVLQILRHTFFCVRQLYNRNETVTQNLKQI